MTVFALILFAVLFLFSCGYAFQPLKRPDPNLKVTTIYECEDVENKLTFENMEFENIDAEGYKALKTSIIVPEDINEDYTYELRTDKWNNGEWLEDIYTREGKLCEEIKQYFGDVWKKILITIDPPFEAECSIRGGLYSLDHLEILKNEYHFPGALYGTIKATAKLFDPRGEEIFCGVLEANLNTY